MNHMTPTGIRGLDLYARVGKGWRFVNSARPNGSDNEATIISTMLPEEREFILYLPLYDGVDSLDRRRCHGGDLGTATCGARA